MHNFQIGDHVKVTDEISLNIRRKDGTICSGVITSFDTCGDEIIANFKSCGNHDFCNVKLLAKVDSSDFRWRRKTN